MTFEQKMNELRERRLCTWFDFIDNEVEPLLEQVQFEKDELEHINSLIEKGTEIQRELNEDYMSNAGYDISYYIKFMQNQISLQDIVIENLKEYLNDIEEWKQNKKVARVK